MLNFQNYWVFYPRPVCKRKNEILDDIRLVQCGQDKR